MEKFKKIAKIAGLVITGVIAVLLLIRLLVDAPKESKQNKDTLEFVKNDIAIRNQTIDSLTTKISNLEKGVFVLYQVISESNEKQQVIENKIDKIQKKFNETIKSISNYTSSDLDSFFRARYKEYY